MFEPFALALAVATATPAESTDSAEAAVLEQVTVTARRVANLAPAGSFAATATELRFDPQINLQARGLPEGQADVTVRGGLFENTGFRLGAVTVIDAATIERLLMTDTADLTRYLPGVYVSQADPRLQMPLSPCGASLAT